jgi:hypothetical protein
VVAKEEVTSEEEMSPEPDTFNEHQMCDIKEEELEVGIRSMEMIGQSAMCHLCTTKVSIFNIVRASP